MSSPIKVRVKLCLLLLIESSCFKLDTVNKLLHSARDRTSLFDKFLHSMITSIIFIFFGRIVRNPRRQRPPLGHIIARILSAVRMQYQFSRSGIKNAPVLQQLKDERLGLY